MFLDAGQSYQSLWGWTLPLGEVQFFVAQWAEISYNEVEGSERLRVILAGF